MDTLAPNNSIIGLKSLHSKENCRPEASDVGREVENELKLQLIEPMWHPADYVI